MRKTSILLFFFAVLAGAYGQDSVRFSTKNIFQIRDTIERGFNSLYRNEYHAAYNTFTDAENDCSAIVDEAKALVKSGASNVSGDTLLPVISSNDTAVIYCRKYLKTALDAYLVLDYQIIAVAMSHVMVKLIEVKQDTMTRYQERQRLEAFVTKFSNELQIAIHSKQTNNEVSKEALRNLQQFILSNFQLFAVAVSNDIDDVRKYTNIITNAVLKADFSTNWLSLSNQMFLYLNYLDMQNENVSRLMNLYSNYFDTMLELQKRMQRMEEENSRISLLALNNMVRNNAGMDTRPRVSERVETNAARVVPATVQRLPKASFPWGVVLAGAGVLCIIFFFIVFSRRRRTERPNAPGINMGYIKEYIDGEDKVLGSAQRKSKR